MIEQTKFRVGKYRIPVKLNYVKGEIEIHSGFNRSLIAEIKALSGAKWHGHDKVFPRKIWTINDDAHNHFQLRYLRGENPYERYDCPLLPFERKPRYNTSKGHDVLPYEHQNEFTRIMITRHYVIVAGEMGTGKTLAVIEAMEWANQNARWATGNRWDGLEHPLFWYVAPKSVLRTIQRELRIWQSGIMPTLMTYDGLVRTMKEWPEGQNTPPFVVLDESSKIKNHTAQRSQAARALADGVRKDWGDNGWVVEMSGTPAPRAPDDWWHQCEVACPGFLKEGDIYKFRNRLGVIEQRESTITGGIFPQLITWRDDDRKCGKCGKLEEDVIHHPNGDVFGEVNFHTFVPGKNEVKLLYERMKGLVHVKMKKDCLDLPDKNYREIVIEPKPDILRASKLIVKSSRTVIEGLSRLRELSDGFQYQERKVGKKPCHACKGSGKGETHQEIPGSCPFCSAGLSREECLANGQHNPEYETVEGPCEACRGSGEEDRYERHAIRVPCPKDDALIDLLDENEELGRIVVYAGFTESVDRCCDVCRKEGWAIIRVDSRGWKVFDSDGQPLIIDDLLSMFQDWKTAYPKVAIVGNPESLGIGATLTAASMEVYYSNEFDGESRTQSEDRIHRPGMDINRGATIVDLIHLPSDRKVLNNLKAKRKLELMSMGELEDALMFEGERSV